jgi:hypothetical protein
MVQPAINFRRRESDHYSLNPIHHRDAETTEKD